MTDLITAQISGPIIDVQHLSFSYDSHEEILHNCDFNLSHGEIMGIVGKSGSGKTTLAYILKGLIPHSITGTLSGSVTIMGLDLKKTKVHELARHVGMVFQDLNAQLFNATVLEEVRFSLRNLNLDLALADDAIRSLQLDSLRNALPMNLSAGQKQRVIIASVIAAQPKILILDEPSAHLDAPSKRILRDWLLKLNRDKGMTILLIDQDPWMMGEVCQHYLLLENKTVTRVDKAVVLETSPGWKWKF